MLGFLKHKTDTATNNTQTNTVKLKLDGMHCVACSVTIDDTLEELAGVSKSTTNYAKSVATVSYDPTLIDLVQIQAAIIELGYGVAGTNNGEGL